MFSKLGTGEILLILIVVVLLFGGSKLPQLGRAVGESMREFKKGMKGEDPSQPEDDKKS